MASNGVTEIENRQPELPLKEEPGRLQVASATNNMWKVVDHQNDPADIIKPLSNTERHPPHGSNSVDCNIDVVEELTLDNYNKASLDRTSDPIAAREAAAPQPRKGQWSHLYQFSRRSKDISFPGDSLLRARNQLMMNSRENLGGQNSHPKESEGDWPGTIDGGRNAVSGIAAIPASGLRFSSGSGFSHFFKNKNVKGKGKGLLDGEHLGARSTLNTDQNSHKRRKAPLEASFDRVGFIDEHSPGNDGHQKDSDVDGISLRELLKPGNCTMNKTERLYVFKQIVELVDTAHSQGIVLLNLLPSFFVLAPPSNKVKYIGSLFKVELGTSTLQRPCKKRQTENVTYDNVMPGVKLQKFIQDEGTKNQKSLRVSKCESGVELFGQMGYDGTLDRAQPETVRRHQNSAVDDLPTEEKCYTCTEEISEKGCTLLSNIYSLGLIFFELFCQFESPRAFYTAIMDIHHRIFPPHFLSENPKEAAFCMWLLHPDQSLRPRTREILLSELLHGLEDPSSKDMSVLSYNDDNEAETELLLDFLSSLKDQREEQACKVMEQIRCLEADILETQKRHLPEAPDSRKSDTSDLFTSVVGHNISSSSKARLEGVLSQLEAAYFSMQTETGALQAAKSDKRSLRNRDNCAPGPNTDSDSGTRKEYNKRFETFSEGLCQFTRYSRFEACGTVKSGEILSSPNVICSLSFDRDEDYFAAAGLSRKIKIFDVNTLLDEVTDIHYPVSEMINGSKLSCISWNSYIRNYLAAADYDGTVKIWDASTGTVHAQFSEHQKRAWSVDFSQVDPMKLASGSDDGSVKLWSVNERRSISTLWNHANVCCVQFSPHSSYLLAFGSADYKIYGYDLRHTRVPWYTLPGHGKAVSYVKFLDANTLLSASTDNTLKLWNLSRTSQSGSSSDVSGLTYTGHRNEKNFVGLSVRDGYVVCGSETNEVFAYHKSFPMPMISHKFGSVDPVSGYETGEDAGLFVSSVCCRNKSNLVVAANSSGSIKLFKMV